MMPSASMRVITSSVCFIPIGLPSGLGQRGARRRKCPRRGVPSAGQGGKLDLLTLLLRCVEQAQKSCKRLDGPFAQKTVLTVFRTPSINSWICSLVGSFDFL